MQLGLSRNRIHVTQQSAGLHLVSRLDRHILKLAVESVVFAVLHQYALVVARHHNHLAHLAFEHRLYLGSGSGRNIHPVVERERHILIDRMVMLPVASDHGAAHRPRELALIARKVGRKLHISLCLRAGLALFGLGLLALGSRLGFGSHQLLYLFVQSIGLLLLLRKFLLIGCLILFQSIHYALFRLLVRLQRLQVRLTLRKKYLIARLEAVQRRLLLLKGGLFVFDGLRLGTQTARNALHIGRPSQSLPEALSCKDIHEPKFGIARKISLAHQLAVELHCGIQLAGGKLYFALLALQGELKRIQLLSGLCYQLLPGLDLLAGELKPGKRIGALRIPCLDLAVKLRDFAAQRFELLLLFRAVLARERKRHEQQNCNYGTQPFQSF